MTRHGRGAIAPDGSPVEVYLRLPHLGEADIVHAAVPEGVAILELGCGVGRITGELVARGHDVVAVDESAQMLDHIAAERVEKVRSTIAELRLQRTFAAVLLGSNLVNSADDRKRCALLAAARRHLADDGVLIVECHPPGWFDTVHDGAGGPAGPVDVRVEHVRRDGDVLTATVHYAVGEHLWTHPFVARRFTDAQLDAELRRHGLRRDRWLSDDHAWFTARGTSSDS